MNEEKDQLVILIRSLKKITVDTIPEIIEMVPMYGPMLSKIIKKVLESAGVFAEEKSNVELQEQIAIIQKAIDENKITEEKVNTTIQKSIIEYMKSKETRLSVYMFGIMLYPYDDSSFEEEDIEEIECALSNEELIYNAPIMQENLNKIQAFCIEYNGGDLLRMNEDYYLDSKCLIINFCSELGKYKRNDEVIIGFIDNLNKILGKDLFVEYSIF